MERLPGVKKVDVSLEKAQAQIEFDDAKTTPERMVAVIDQLGFRAKVLDVNPPR